MNNKEYLEQISAEARPLKPQKTFFGFDLSSKMVRILIGAVAAAFLIIIVGMIARSGGSDMSTRDLLDQLYIRTDNLSQTITDYNNRVKSSDLRSLGTSLRAVLSETNYTTSTILQDVYAATPGNPASTKIRTDEDQFIAELNDSLEVGRLNGVLDRVYVRELTYQIGLLSALESSVISSTNSDSVKSAISASQANLDQLYDRFNTLATE